MWRPVVHYVNPKYYRNVPLLYENTVEAFMKQIEAFIMDEKKRERVVKKQLEYVKLHNVKNLIPKLVKMYENLADD